MAKLLFANTVKPIMNTSEVNINTAFLVKVSHLLSIDCVNNIIKYYQVPVRQYLTIPDRNIPSFSVYYNYSTK